MADHDPREHRSYPSAMDLARAICAAARGVSESEYRALLAARRQVVAVKEVPRGE